MSYFHTQCTDIGTCIDCHVIKLCSIQSNNIRGGVGDVSIWAQSATFDRKFVFTFGRLPGTENAPVCQKISTTPDNARLRYWRFEQYSWPRFSGRGVLDCLFLRVREATYIKFGDKIGYHYRSQSTFWISDMMIHFALSPLPPSCENGRIGETSESSQAQDPISDMVLARNRCAIWEIQHIFPIQFFFGGGMSPILVFEIWGT